MAGVFIVIGVASAFAADSPAQPPPESLTELSLEQLMEVPIVVAASRYEQRSDTAPASVSVVTAADIRAYGYRTLADILVSVPGFYTTYDRYWTFVTTRGFSRLGDYNDRILVLVDGHRINENLYDSFGPGNEFLLDVDNIDRVEIVRGPSSSLYGTGAFFGVINIVTRSGRDYDGAEISVSAASYDTYVGRLTGGQQRGDNVEWSAGVSFLDSAGQDLYFPEFDDPETNDGWAEGVDDESALRLFGKAALGRWLLQAVYATREKSVPTGQYDTLFNVPGSITTDSWAVATLGYRREIREGLQFWSRLSYNDYHYEGDFMYDYGDPGEPWIVTNRDNGRGRWFGAEAGGELKNAAGNHLAFGAEYRYNAKLDQSNYDEEVYLDDQRSSKTWGVYLQDEFWVGKRVGFTLGARYDYFDGFGGTFNPRAAIVIAPAEGTAVKLLYGSAFRAPNAYEMYYNDGDIYQKANPLLEPETVQTYEAVFEQALTRSMRATLALYHYCIDDLIAQVEDPADELLVFENIERAEGQGVELELRGRWAGGIGAQASYAYQDVTEEATEEGTEETFNTAPKHTVKLAVAVPLLEDRLSLGIATRYLSSRLTYAGSTLSSYWTGDLTLVAGPWRNNLELSASIYNLFDETYSDPVSIDHVQEAITQNGRNFRLKLGYRF